MVLDVFFCMTHSNSQKAQTALIGALALVFALAASQAYAADSGEEPVPTSKVTVYEKVAITETPALIRKEQIPPRPVIKLNTTTVDPDEDKRPLKVQLARYERNQDLRKFDLVEDSPVFIGAPGVNEYDTLEAQRESARYPQTLNVDPLFTVAGAGVATSF